MPKKKKSTVKKAADDLGRLPEATAHTFRREMELPHEAIEKFREVLAEGLPVKISLDVTSKIFAPLVENKKIAEVKVGDGDVIIDESNLQPPDPGEPIPDGDVPPELEGTALDARVGTPPAWKLVGAKVEVYAVAVFRPRYANGP